MTHPSRLKLEAHLLDPAHSPVSQHVEGCEDCRADLLGMEREGQDFMRFVYPATVESLMPKKARRWTLANVLAPVAALAAAGVILVVNRPQPAPDYTGTKGVALKLDVYAAFDSGPHALSDKERVPASAALRFHVQPSRACHLSIVSVDERGQVSRLFPASGDVGPTVNKADTLPGGAILDGQPGPERIYAFCTPDALPVQQVEEAVKVAAGTGAASVRAPGDVHGLPSGTSQATLLLEKAR
jgi:hypothetical protein